MRFFICWDSGCWGCMQRKQKQSTSLEVLSHLAGTGHPGSSSCVPSWSWDNRTGRTGSISRWSLLFHSISAPWWWQQQQFKQWGLHSFVFKIPLSEVKKSTLIQGAAVTRSHSLHPCLQHICCPCKRVAVSGPFPWATFSAWAVDQAMVKRVIRLYLLTEFSCFEVEKRKSYLPYL